MENSYQKYEFFCTFARKRNCFFLFISLYFTVNFAYRTFAPKAHPPLAENFNCFGAVAQLGERFVRNEEVVGSIPISSTTVDNSKFGVRYSLFFLNFEY